MPDEIKDEKKEIPKEETPKTEELPKEAPKEAEAPKEIGEQRTMVEEKPAEAPTAPVMDVSKELSGMRDTINALTEQVATIQQVLDELLTEEEEEKPHEVAPPQKPLEAEKIAVPSVPEEKKMGAEETEKETKKFSKKIEELEAKLKEMNDTVTQFSGVKKSIPSGQKKEEVESEGETWFKEWNKVR